MTDHKANPKQWVRLEERRLGGNDLVCAVLELRARVEALEDAQPEPQRPSVMDIIALSDEVEEEGLGQVDLVRRALARWGHHTTDHLLGEEKPD
jgi:hypothetical protein